jgi:DNA polymerase
MIGLGGVVRFMYQFGGASRTLRFSGRGVQPQNMTRTPKLLDPEHDDTKLSIATDLIRGGNYDGFDLFINEPMEALTGCMRGMFRAPKGYELRTADYKSVETAGLAWIAQCPNLLKIFSDKLDPYRFFGSLWYKKPMDQINSFERQLSKPPMLACGYRLSPGENRDGVLSGLIAYADNMGVPMTQEEANAAVTIYRTEFPEVKQFWYDCEDAVRQVLTTGEPVQLGFLRFEWMKPYLLIRLPSGRYIYYYKPKLEKSIVGTGRYRRVRSRGFFEDGVPEGEWVEVEETYVRHNFSYMGRNQNTTQWERVPAHGGVTTENVVQALTRDILKVGLTKLHKEGFDVRGHSHDEGIALQRIGDNFYTVQRMLDIFREEISWAPGFPLDASGWAASFYRKA